MSDRIDTCPAAVAAPSFTFEAPYDAYVRTALHGQYIALYRAGGLIATFSFTEWGGEQGAIQAAWRFAYNAEICTECEALAAERDRLAAENARLRETLNKVIALDRRINCRNGNILEPMHIDGPLGKIARAALNGDSHE